MLDPTNINLGLNKYHQNKYKIGKDNDKLCQLFTESACASVQVIDIPTD